MAAVEKYKAPHWATPPPNKEVSLLVRRSGSDAIIATHSLGNMSTYVIGRLVGLSDIVIEDTELSRQHAALVHSKGKVYLIDLKSAKGVFIGNKRLTSMEPLELGEGATFRLGEASPLRFVVRGLVPLRPAPAAAPVPAWTPPEWAVTPATPVAMMLEKDGQKVKQPLSPYALIHSIVCRCGISTERKTWRGHRPACAPIAAERFLALTGAIARGLAPPFIHAWACGQDLGA